MSTRPVHDLEARWQQQWELDRIYRAELRPDAERFFGLIEFPFPSGDGLHVGHLRPFTGIDVYTRKQRMLGKNVMFPIGWDAFGLPTENYAIKNKVRPQDATAKNVANFTRQAKSLGLGFDWSREVNTTDPEYFKWTQWQFLQFVKHGMAYKAVSEINWCPRCKIGLANEEAQGGVCERCGNPVEKREKSQWMISITDYAERLIKDLDKVDYLDKIKTQQRNWIGKSEGATIRFAAEQGTTIEVFTTRPDTLFGVTYVVLAPEHALVDVLTTSDQRAAIDAYRAETARATDEQRLNENRPKTGVFTGGYAINPANNERVPVWIADYVLATYGTGAVMAVPAHDERDFAFAKLFGLPVKQVVAPYIRLSGDCTPREDKSTVSRQVVTAIIRNAATGKYLLLDMADQRRGFVGGGIEGDETAQAALVREIQEETGYDTIISSRCLGKIYGHGYKKKRDVNCFDPDQVFLVEVSGEPGSALSEEDRHAHQVVWKEKNEVENFVTLEHHLFIWRWYLSGVGCFTEEGYAINSDFITEAPTWKAKEEIIAWLEETGHGQRKTTYRLRDWVFSRQRYWGEPIPLVKCEACATKKQKAVIVHRMNATAFDDWYPALKAELEAKGFSVEVPSLPDPDAPTYEGWLQALKPLVASLGEDDVLVGHSIGGRMAIHALLEANVNIGHLYLVAPLVGPMGDLGNSPLRDIAERPIDWERLNTLVASANVLVSENDDRVPKATHAVYPKGWFIKSLGVRGHFRSEYEPEVINEVLRSQVTGWTPVPENQLPLELPPIEAYTPSDDGESPLATMPEWFNTTCPRCHGPAKRETDTMPNWAGSSWYFLRYVDPKNTEAFASDELMKRWLPVDIYNGGMEHTTLHLLYSRFWHKLLFDMGFIPAECGDEPYRKRRSQGLVLAQDGEKMSKSKGNVVNPDDVVKEVGADVLRTYIMFMGPFDQPVPWDMNGIQGVKRFLDSVWSLYQLPAASSANIRPVHDGQIGSGLRELYHQTVKKVTEDIDALKFNTCVSQLMILSNLYLKNHGIPEDQREGFLQLLAPFAPHVADELWQVLGKTGSIHLSSWPTYDPSALEADTYDLVVQVNGKVRGKVRVSRDIAEDAAREAALASDDVRRWTEGKVIEKVVFVPGRLISFTVPTA